MFLFESTVHTFRGASSSSTAPQHSLEGFLPFGRDLVDIAIDAPVIEIWLFLIVTPSTVLNLSVSIALHGVPL